MNILITGATGFIGSHLTKKLCKQGYHCRCLVRNIEKAGEIFKDYEDIEFVVGDLTIPETLKNLNEGIDCVINVAGLLAKWNSTEKELRAINTDGPVNLVRSFSDKGIKHFIQISTGGATGPIYGAPADENYICNPITLYEKSKYLGEIDFKKYCEKCNVPYTVVRPTFTYGPGDAQKLALFKLVNKGLILTFGGGNSTNQPVYIDDLVNGIVLALKKSGTGQTYIIGGERSITKKEFQETIARIFARKTINVNIPKRLAFLIAYIMEFFSKMFKINPILSLSRANMMCKDFKYNITKAKRELNYQPKFDLTEGIRNTIRYYKNKGIIR